MPAGGKASTRTSSRNAETSINNELIKKAEALSDIPALLHELFGTIMEQHPTTVTHAKTVGKMPASGKASTRTSSHNADTPINNELIKKAEALSGTPALLQELFETIMEQLPTTATHAEKAAQAHASDDLKGLSIKVDKVLKELGSTEQFQKTTQAQPTIPSIKDLTKKMDRIITLIKECIKELGPTKRIQKTINKAVLPNQPEGEKVGINIDAVTMDQQTVDSRKRPPPSETLDDHSPKKQNTGGNDKIYETPEWLKMKLCNIPRLPPLFCYLQSLHMLIYFLIFALRTPFSLL